MATVGRRSEPLTCDYELNWLWLVSRQFVTPTIITVFFLKILVCLLAKNFRSEATSFLTNTGTDMLMYRLKMKRQNYEHLDCRCFYK